ncbi:MAG: PAS domain-containing protein [Spirochaetales bacterium]|nr:PAS domain-containing protein [Spirochaetales bacterium]
MKNKQCEEKELQLKTQTEILEKIFSNTFVLFVYMDPGFFILRVNSAFAKAAGDTADFYTGKNYFDLFPDKEKTILFQRVLQTQTPATLYAHPVSFPNNPTQDTRYMDVNLQPTISAAGRTDGLILILVDVTEQKKSGEKLLETQKQLSESKRLASIGKLAAIVAHEIRNPLGAIAAALYNIENKNQDPKILPHIALIEKKIDESEHIIQNLLSYSHIKKPIPEKTLVIPLLKESISSIVQQFKKQGDVNIITDFNSVKDVAVNLDPYQIREVLINILNNAHQSLEDMKGTISIKAMIEDSQNLSISIKDDGRGIKQENLDSIFDPFFTTKTKGTGLGLSICREIISLHNGTISILSRETIGTEVTVRLPLHRENTPN